MTLKINRRTFMQSAAAAGGLLAVGPAFGAAAPPLPVALGLSEGDLRAALEVAMGKGGDFADLYFQRTVSNAISLEDHRIDRAMSSLEQGVGVRVIKGDAVGYAYAEEPTAAALCEAAKAAREVADGSAGTVPKSFRVGRVPRYYPRTEWEHVPVARRRKLLADVEERIRAADKRIVKVNVSFGDSESQIYVVNTDGQAFADYQPMTRLGTMCVASDGKRTETGGYNIAARDGVDFYSAERVKRLIDESVRRTILMFEAAQPVGGDMPVVLGAGASGILLHEAIGHGMEADFNRKNTSLYASLLNKKVAAPFVNIVDDGTLPNARGAIGVDDEGQITEQTHLVTDGVLTSYLHDRISAKHYGVKQTGNGRRESFRHVVMPRMRCTYMLPGPHGHDEIVKSVKKGIYCESFSNGEVHIGPGDYTFFVKTGYLIEDGKLTRPIKDVNIIGNGPDTLRKVTMVGNDLKIDEGGWTCGKNGQSVPVSQGMPTVLVSSLTVGGRSA